MATHSKLRKRDIKQRKNSFCCRNQYFFFIFITRGEHLPRGGIIPQPLLYLLYIAPRVHSLRGFFCLLDTKAANAGPAWYQGRQCRPGFPHTKNAARKNAAKSKHKKHCKKIFIFLIILHIKYEDKKRLSSRRQNIKK